MSYQGRHATRSTLSRRSCEPADMESGSPYYPFHGDSQMKKKHMYKKNEEITILVETIHTDHAAED